MSTVNVDLGRQLVARISNPVGNSGGAPAQGPDGLNYYQAPNGQEIVGQKATSMMFFDALDGGNLASTSLGGMPIAGVVVQEPEAWGSVFADETLETISNSAGLTGENASVFLDLFQEVDNGDGVLSEQEGGELMRKLDGADGTEDTFVNFEAIGIQPSN